MIEANKLFDDFPCMYCEEFREGHQTFRSWEQFLKHTLYYLKSNTLPRYVFNAEFRDNTVYVDVSQVIEVPWDELDNMM